MSPPWMQDILSEPWPLDFGAYPAQDFDARTSSSGSSAQGGTLVKHEVGTVVQHDNGAFARSPLAAIASSSRGIFDRLPLEAMFVPPSQAELHSSRPNHFAFDFECPTAIRVQPAARQPSTSPLADRVADHPTVPFYESLSQGEEATAETDGTEHSSLENSQRAPPGDSPAKRVRLDPDMSQSQSREQGVALEVERRSLPASAVRERIRARRAARRISLPPSFGATEPAAEETPIRPIRHSLPATAGPLMTSGLGVEERQIKAANIMQKVRNTEPLEPLFTPIRAPPPRRDYTAPPTAGMTALAAVPEDEENEETQSFDSQNSPFERPMPPTPIHALSLRPLFAPDALHPDPEEPFTPARPASDALAASAVDELFVPSPPFSEDLLRAANVALPGSVNSSPDPSAPPRSALKRAFKDLPGRTGNSPRTVSFGDNPAVAHPQSYLKSGSTLKFEIPEDASTSLRGAQGAELLDTASVANKLTFSNLGAALDTLRGSASALICSAEHRKLQLIHRPGSAALSGSAGSAGTFAAPGHRGAHLGHSTNATFLTECSFGVARDDLVRYITDIEPFTPHWDRLRFADLSGKHIQSIARLKDFLPRLDEVRLCDNEIAHLTGLPDNVRGLSIARNRLNDVSAFQKFVLLERLDISGNQLQDTRQLRSLRHLREIKADDCAIESMDGLYGLDTLVKVSLRRNRINAVEALQVRWPALELLDLAGNQLVSIQLGPNATESLVNLNLDGNSLTSFTTVAACPALRVLRLCRNPLVALDTRPLKALRTLFLDETKLKSIMGLPDLHKLENLSIRTLQSKYSVALSVSALRDIRRAYLCGQSIDWRILEQPCFNLAYLELVMCRLSILPPDLARTLPNCRSLVLDLNSLKNIDAVAGMKRLRRLSIPGNQVAGCRSILKTLGGLTELEILDTRSNPCVGALYLPAPLSSMPEHADHAMHGLTVEEKEATLHEPQSAQIWREADGRFAKSLPDSIYIRRALWRTLAVQAAPHLRFLDGRQVVGEAKGGQALLQRLDDSGKLHVLLEQMTL